MTRIIVINPQHQTITERELPPSHDIHEIIGDTCTIAGIINGPAHEWQDVIYVDDEGLSKSELEYFLLRGVTGQPFAGIGVVAGSDSVGETVSATSSIADIKLRVVFMTRTQVEEFFGSGSVAGSA